MNHEQIVVGVDGSASSWRALEWAAHQAEITGRSLLVAYLGEAQQHLGNYGYGNALATDIVASVTENHPALLVHAVVIEGEPADFLLRAANGEAMLVLGREPTVASLTSLAPALAEVVTHSECPVVFSGGPTAGDEPTATRIVLGVSASAGGRAAMRFACGEAVRAGATVLAVRSSLDPNWKSAEGTSPPCAPATRELREQNVLAECIDEARAYFPGVQISGLLTAEAVRFALARESHNVSLVVLGRAPTDGSHIQKPGPDTLIALHSLTCAVAVVGSERGADDREGGHTGRELAPTAPIGLDDPSLVTG